MKDNQKYFTVSDNGEIYSYINTNSLSEAVKIADAQKRGLVVISRKTLKFIEQKFNS